LPGDGFSYDKSSGEFLLLGTDEGRRGTDGNREVLWQYDPQTETLTKIADDNTILNEQWFGEGKSAYFRGDAQGSRIPKRSAIVLRNEFGIETGRVLENANILWFHVAADNGELLFLGTPTNQPFAGIWRLDLATEKLQPAILYSDEPSDYAKNIRPEHITVKTASGKKLQCTIFPPVNFNPHRKYPLLIGDTIFTALTYRSQEPSWAPAIANCGGYVVIVDRDRWFVGLTNWGADILAAYNALKPSSRFDASQVFLFASSVETSYMNGALTNSPGLWKGAILLSPTALPDLSQVSLFDSSRLIVGRG
jgi:hypothetical protein